MKDNNNDYYSYIPLCTCIGLIFGMFIGAFTQSLWSPVSGLLIGCFAGIVVNIVKYTKSNND